MEGIFHGRMCIRFPFSVWLIKPKIGIIFSFLFLLWALFFLVSVSGQVKLSQTQRPTTLAWRIQTKRENHQYNN